MPRISKSQLIKLQKRYHSDQAVGELFGITRQAVQQLRRRLAVAPVAGRHTRRNAEIARLYASGSSGARLARRFRLSAVQVYRILKQEGVSLRKPRRPAPIAL
jgi:transposase